MPLTNTQALLLSNDQFLAGLIENDPKQMQLAQFFPFYQISGDSLTIPRTTFATIGTAIFDAGATAVSDTPAVPNSPNVTFSLKLIISEFKNNYTAQYDMSNVNDQSQVQILAAVRRMLYTFWTKFYTGDQGANPQEFNGLRTLVPAGQKITANAGAGGQPTMLEFDRLLGLIKTDTRTSDIFLVGNSAGYRAWRQAYYALGTTPSVYYPMSVPDGLGGMRTALVPTHDGVRFLIDDNITSDEAPSNYTSIYAVALGPNGLHGIIPEGTKDSMFQVRKTLVDGKAQDVSVIYWPVGLALGGESWIARIEKCIANL